jgi:2-keto-4-pentenoate hydratase/2-oxohepta-3-ene-1,7-dioic acid hydratase in catechol pathway
MKLASVLVRGVPSFGLVDDDSLVDVGAVLRPQFADLKAVIAGAGLAALGSATTNAGHVKLTEVTFLPVIPVPNKILCVGLNYEMHRRETGRAVVEHPTIFARFLNSQVGHAEPMVLPAVSEKFDYEGELAVIIGTAAWRVTPEQAMQHVAGYACYNDGSIRDWQQHTSQYTPGKNFLATGGFGPWMVTADAFGAVGPQRISTRLNGQTVQDAHLSDMIFDVARVISYCSAFTRLEPGDVIAMGTPGGVGAKRQPPLWMKAGDTVEVEIEGIGVLRNPIAAEAAA